MLSEHKKFVRVIQSNRWDDGLNQEMSDQGSQPDEESVAFCTWQLLVLPQSSVRNKKNKHSFYPQLFFLGHLVLLQHPGSYRTWRLMHRRKEGKNISLSSSSGSTNNIFPEYHSVRLAVPVQGPDDAHNRVIKEVHTCPARLQCDRNWGGLDLLPWFKISWEAFLQCGVQNTQITHKP